MKKSRSLRNNDLIRIFLEYTETVNDRETHDWMKYNTNNTYAGLNVRYRPLPYLARIVRVLFFCLLQIVSTRPRDARLCNDKSALFSVTVVTVRITHRMLYNTLLSPPIRAFLRFLVLLLSSSHIDFLFLLFPPPPPSLSLSYLKDATVISVPLPH